MSFRKTIYGKEVNIGDTIIDPEMGGERQIIETTPFRHGYQNLSPARIVYDGSGWELTIFDDDRIAVMIP